MPILVLPPSLPTTADGLGTPGAVLHDGLLVLGETTLGATDEYGVEWILEDLSGWSDSPGSTGTVEQRASDHGGWFSPAHLQPRVLEVEGSLLAASWDAATRAIGRLMESIPLSVPDWLYVAENEQVLQALVRQEGDPLTERSGGWARFSLSLLAADPRKYDTTLVTASTGFPILTGGFVMPLVMPLVITSSVTSGVLTVTNAGNFPTRPVLTVTGPSPPFTITHQGTGRTLSFHETLDAGRTLVIDTDKRRALLDGTAPRLLTGAWFEYDPGVNQVSFNAATYEAAAVLTSEHRSAWR